MLVNKHNFEEALSQLGNEKLWCIDFETYNPYEGQWFQDLSKKQRPLDRLHSKMVAFQIQTDDGRVYYFDIQHKGDDFIGKEGISKIMNKAPEGIIGHNLSFEIGILKNYGINYTGRLYDTMVMHFLYNSNIPQGLKQLVKLRFNHQMSSYADTVGSGTMKDITAEEGYKYGTEDVIWTYKLYEWLVDKIDMDYYEIFEEDIIRVVVDHYRQGQVIDLNTLDRIQAEDIQTKNKILADFPELAALNLNSPKQVANFLFNDLGLKPYKVSHKTGQPSTDKESLYELEVKYGKDYPVIKAFGELRKIETRQKLYYRPYPKLLYPDGKLHSEIRQTGTQSGRFSMSSPNLQQVAKRGEGKKVRDIFIPFEGHDCIVSIDWSQIELRMAAHMSEDPKLLDAYLTGKDLHTVSGTNLSGLSYEEMKELLEKDDPEQKKHRQRGKTLNFAALYGAQARRLAAYDLLDCSEAEAEMFLQAHKIGYKGYFYDYVNSVKAYAKANKVAYTLFGRPRYFPNITSPIKALRAEAENQALNHTIQGSCAELMRAALVSLLDEGILFQNDFTFIAPVHDEFVFSCTVEAAAKYLPKVKEIMERTPPGFKVPIIAESSIGPNFGDQRELHGDLSIENMKEKLYG